MRVGLVFVMVVALLVGCGGVSEVVGSSEEPTRVRVPSILGESTGYAEQVLADLDLSLQIEVDNSLSGPSGIIVDQTPSAGTIMATGSQIVVKVPAGIKTQSVSTTSIAQATTTATPAATTTTTTTQVPTTPTTTVPPTTTVTTVAPTTTTAVPTTTTVTAAATTTTTVAPTTTVVLPSYPRNLSAGDFVVQGFDATYRASGDESYSVEISWEPPVDNGSSSIENYEIRQTYFSEIESWTVEGVKLTTTADFLVPHRQYAIQVRAIDSESNPGPWSDQIKAPVPALPPRCDSAPLDDGCLVQRYGMPAPPIGPAPGPPTNLVASWNINPYPCISATTCWSETPVTLTWEPPTDCGTSVIWDGLRAVDVDEYDGWIEYHKYYSGNSACSALQYWIEGSSNGGATWSTVSHGWSSTTLDGLTESVMGVRVTWPGGTYLFRIASMVRHPYSPVYRGTRYTYDNNTCGIHVQVCAGISTFTSTEVTIPLLP